MFPVNHYCVDKHSQGLYGAGMDTTIQHLDNVDYGHLFRFLNGYYGNRRKAAEALHKTMNYYNDNDSFSVKWLKALIAEGLIPKGDVDDRSITEIKPNELDGYTQCHFFAGIGGWPYALRLSGWPEDRPVWTGSCPCQPFSVAGQGKGIEDERHLWPAFRWLIAQKRPATIFGEQVASSDGREWLSGVRLDLETMGYEVGAADLCAAGVGAPHIRQRLFWVAKITPPMKSWLKKQDFKIKPEYETEKFIDHFQAKGEAKKDWVAAWRNWMRKANEYCKDDRSDWI
jgi:site-specific DNA-cytosine methylase